MKTKSILSFVKWVILLFIIFVPSIVHVVKMARGTLEGIHTGYYYVGYDTGFGGRKFVGTVCNLLFYGTLSPPPTSQVSHLIGHRELLPILLGCVFICIVLFVFLIAWGFRRHTALGLAATLGVAFSPYAFHKFFLTYLSVDYIDIWLYMFTLVWMVCFVVCKTRRWWYYVLSALLLSMAVLTHPLYCCMLFPLALGLFAYDSISEQGFIHRRRLLPYGAICLLLFAILLVIMFFDTMKVDVDTLYRSICDRTVLGVFRRDKHIFNVVFYLDIMGNVKYQLDAGNLQSRWMCFLPSLLLLSPVFAFLLSPWYRAMKQATTRLMRLRYLLPVALLLIFTLPVFLIATDYCRWFYALFFGLFMLSVVGVGLDDKGVLVGWNHTLNWIKRHPFLAAAMFLYVAWLQNGNAFVMAEVRTIFDWLGIFVHC